jgi:hypothetical protein
MVDPVRGENSIPGVLRAFTPLRDSSREAHDMRNEVEAELVPHGRGDNRTKLGSMLLRGASKSRKWHETSRR